MNKFPSINQFKHYVKGCKKAGRTQVLVTGTPKLHGTNSAIRFGPDGSVSYQSRNRVITPEDDNAGFANAMEPISDQLHTILPGHVYQLLTDGEPVTVFGEWCGGNIQKGVALSKLPKMFVTFAIQYGDGEGGELDFEPEMYNDELGIYSIHHFPSWDVSVDVHNPGPAQETFVNITERVEQECPVGKAFGVSGTGEGVVWRDVYGHVFKVKGDKHSNSKVKKLKNPEDVEKDRKVQHFVEGVVTEPRLNQALEYLREMNKPLDQTSTGDFIRWVFDDIIKEESDTMDELGLTRKDIGSTVAGHARPWFFNVINEV